MYTADAGRGRARPARRPDDGAARQDARRLVGHQLHGVRPRASRATSTRGPPTARRVGVTTTVLALLQEERRSRRRAATSSSTPMPTTPKVRSASRCALRFCAARRSSSTLRSRPGSRSVTTTAATAEADAGVVSLLQTTTRDGKRSSTYHAFLEGDVEQRPNLEVISHAQVTRVHPGRWCGQLNARGVEYRTADGETAVALATKEVVLSAGAVGSPQILLLSGVGPKR